MNFTAIRSYGRSRVPAVLLPILLVVSAGCDLAMADYKEKATAEWRKSYEIQPGGRVEIGNVNGKVVVRAGEGNAVEVVAIKTGRGATPEAAKEALERLNIRETVSPSEVKIETQIDRTGGLFNHSGSIEYTVRVPASVELKATTVNGGVEIEGVSGRVIAETTNGGIHGRGIAGPIEASTTNGGVDVEVTQVTDAGVRLECTNGGIKLRLPADARASISARVTNGGIDTGNLPLQTRGESSRRRLDADMNGGGPRIALEGTNGGISITSR